MAKYVTRINGKVTHYQGKNNQRVTITHGTPPEGFVAPEVEEVETPDTSGYELVDSTEISVKRGSIQINGSGARIYKNGKRAL